ncbi:MAG: S-methyl-5-thioribose kinase [Acidimicrobiia bacterium]|nr:S-methyl-5-thioribose kinase [Acidimicrobiia bacterium]
MYRILDRTSVPDYLRSIPAVNEVLGEGELEIGEIGDGNLNYVYRVTNVDDPKRAVILKQAVPYLRMAGEDWPLSRDRMTFEIRALTVYNDLVPGFVPKMFHADEEMSAMVMQFLDDHIILRKGMIDGITYPDVARHIGNFLGETLFRTSSYGMASEDRRQLMDRFTLNSELCKLTEDFIFTFPYMTHSSNYSNPSTDAWADANLRNNTEYKLDVLAFKDLFLTKTDALLHADLHTGSLMVNQAESYVIDMEFAYFGPFGFDVGKIISNFLLCATAHVHLSGGAEYRSWLIDQIGEIWNVFSERFLALWNEEGDSAMLHEGLLDAGELASMQERFMLDLFQQSIGFAACSMARRTLGIAGVADIRDIEDLEIRSSLEIANLEMSMALMAKRTELTTIDELLAFARHFYDNYSFKR